MNQATANHARKLFPRPLRPWARLCGLLFLAGLGCNGRGATAIGPLSYNIRIWQTDDGLPQNSVFTLAQTPDGYLWVGTHEGLARFDGEHFFVVDEPQAPELKHGWITALCLCRDGSLWIASDGNGLTRLKGGTVAHFTEAQGLPSNQTRCLLEAGDGALWVGTENGVACYRNGQFTRFTDRQGLGDNSVRALCQDRQGIIRVATKRGLSSLSKPGRFSNLMLGTNWNANAARYVCEDSQGNIWVGATEGLNCLGGKQKRVYGPGDGLADRVINCIFEDHRHQLWVGTYSGLSRIIDGEVVPCSGTETVFGDLVNTVFEDREGTLWVGGRDGLSRLTPARFKTYATEQGLPRNNVMSVCEDPSGTLWVGVWDGGLNALRDDRITTYPTPDVLARDSVLSLEQGRDGLWIGMDFTGGLNRFTDGRRIAVPKPAGLLNAPIRVIHEDRHGVLWIGTSSGLNVCDQGKCSLYARTNGLAGDTVFVVYEDRAGHEWIGTDGGLSYWSEDHFTNYTTSQGLSHNVVDALYEDSSQTLWIGTRGGGLNRFKDGKFTACTTQQGLFSDEIYEILEDDFGYFWMTCRQGIFHVARRDLEELAEGAIRHVDCVVFGKADGLLSVQCNGVAKPAGWKARDGRLWFPTIRGVVAVETRIKTNDQPPPVAIESVLADRKEVSTPVMVSRWPSPSLTNLASGALTIPPGRGELEIRYAALSLQAPEKNRFKYRLEGADSGWIDAGGQRAARYYNLAPGNYRFQVTACNNDGVWNLTGAAVALVLQPHYWQTWWFKLASVLPVGLLLTGLYRFRVARLREIERLRIQIAANLHDDVGARLTKVAMVTEFVDRETSAADRVKPHVQTIARTTSEIIQAMDEIVWTINPKNDTLENLANYIFQYAQEYFQDTGVRCRLDFPAQLPEYAVSTEARHNLFMAVKEALNNVLKHAGATDVQIGLAVADEVIRLNIADNGRGFEPGAVRPGGNGLANMKQRLDRIGGRLVLESKPGSGTRLQMEAAL